MESSACARLLTRHRWLLCRLAPELFICFREDFFQFVVRHAAVRRASSARFPPTEAHPSHQSTHAIFRNFHIASELHSCARTRGSHAHPWFGLICVPSYPGPPAVNACGQSTH